MNDVEALKLARDAHSASTTYVDANFRKQWQDALKAFQSKHPADSKYNSEAYKYRSRLFRPKTRSVIRKNEAAVAAAFFSNVDVVNVQATNDKNPNGIAGAALYKELLQYRLTKTIPWFLTLVGGAQDAMTVGVVCSYQHWKYRERSKSSRNYVVDEETGVPMMGFEGGPMYYDHETNQVIEDCPAVELRPVENLRIDKGAIWTNPVMTSPYLIDMIPMYVGDVKIMGEPNRKTGEVGWDVPEDSKLLAATRNAYDQTRQVREGNREDSKDSSGSANPTDYDIVWVHKNIVRKAGEDFCYYTLGVEHLLSKPTPLEDVYLHGERPYVMGCAIIETHKIYPGGFPELGKEVQKEINETTNQRQDNVKLALNKKYLVRRGSQTDVKGLVRNVAGSAVMVNDIEKDVREMEFNDVTASAFQEQDRLNVEFDELLGNFSTSSVQTNRKLNETVGGMALMNQGASQMTEFTIRTLTETWIEPVLRQLVKLEKHYETDETILKLMGDKLGVPIQDEMFDVDIELNVNVGMGATDPIQRVNKLLVAGRAVAEIAALQVPNLNINEFGKEVFSAVGYRDGGRFLQEGEDPKLAQVKQDAQTAITELQDELQKAKLNMEAKLRESELKRDQAAEAGALSRDKAAADHELAVEKIYQEFKEESIRLNVEIQTVLEKRASDIRMAQEKSDMQREIAAKESAAKIEIAAMQAAAKIEIAEANAKASREAAAIATKAKEDADKQSAKTKEASDKRVAELLRANEELIKQIKEKESKPKSKRRLTIKSSDGDSHTVDIE